MNHQRQLRFSSEQRRKWSQEPADLWKAALPPKGPQCIPMDARQWRPIEASTRIDFVMKRLWSDVNWFRRHEALREKWRCCFFFKQMMTKNKSNLILNKDLGRGHLEHAEVWFFPSRQQRECSLQDYAERSTTGSWEMFAKIGRRKYCSMQNIHRTEKVLLKETWSQITALKQTEKIHLWQPGQTGHNQQSPWIQKLAELIRSSAVRV